MFPLFATGVVDNGGKFDAGIVDTGGKFATSINNTNETGRKNLPPVSLIPVVHLDLQKFETVLLEYSGAGG